MFTHDSLPMVWIVLGLSAIAIIVLSCQLFAPSNWWHVRHHLDRRGLRLGSCDFALIVGLTEGDRR